jgi:hypothetical protein
MRIRLAVSMVVLAAGIFAPQPRQADREPRR